MTCPTCKGAGQSKCRLCKEVHRGVPPYIGCAGGGTCPDCDGSGLDKTRLEAAKRAVSDRMRDRRVDRYIEDPDVWEEAVEDFTAVAVTAYLDHTEET